MTRIVRYLTTALAIVWAVSASRPTVFGAMGQWLPDDGSYTGNPAINYAGSTPSDAVARLQQDILSGARRLSFTPETGYLDSVLAALAIPRAPQLLVFTRTSFQRDLISPANPRTLYFGPDAYVGFIPHAPLLEIASIDPQLGAVFYTLQQEETARPSFVRETTRCLPCHESASATAGVPGLLMTSDAGHSDPVALERFAQQTHVQNLITRLGYRTRMAQAFDRIRNAELGRPADFVPPDTAVLVAREAGPLVHALRTATDAQVTNLIDSPAFGALPAPARQYVHDRLGTPLAARARE